MKLTELVPQMKWKP